MVAAQHNTHNLFRNENPKELKIEPYNKCLNHSYLINEPIINNNIFFHVILFESLLYVTCWMHDALEIF